MKKYTHTKTKHGPPLHEREWQEAASLFGTLKEKADAFAESVHGMEGEMSVVLREGQKAVRDAAYVLNGPGDEYQEEVARIVEGFVDALREG